ncbi:DNA-binding transcriptional response regulator, NtrC family, contains REC, AAA-type ATPase, and a Fis-type DNA-binding domains [Billgrantia gudaonensis]|uniref:DNA-binding transcriptional response regulator, NtrC family, contains REC, AAA-type ATPase, and a Fis-type DNA-binding domains n=1 Tax=Billgrantia gudaonensis TaxID=376427 RepID=A0A1G8PMN6_9GAMM|nr:phosphoenolpyruvate hydrolase family protein [Halomonas gudaonensis]SDI93586.1 DNA-binding transcriptional response regulator, NtrC family, contains REC, AAA-type ATPase, and a Fis-type DNA-binding domains [Halomonas gudaonensis]
MAQASTLDNRRFLVGAAIGTGMTAKAAAHGGADFLLALNAGRLRVQGGPSIACMLPLADNNRAVMSFSRAEILTRVALPVYFGACVFDPDGDLETLVQQVSDAGFQGICNFPTVVHFDGALRARLEANGVGLAREVRLLQLARKAGLRTCGYVRELAEAAMMADAGVDMLCINYGWNAGGASGVPSRYSLDEAAEHARVICEAVRARHPRLLCTVEGGPITNPDEAKKVAEISGANGYIGGSTIDRIPLEAAVAETTSAYKAVAQLQNRLHNLKSEWLGDGHEFGLIGRSAVITDVVQMIRKVANSDISVLVTGENGTGKELVARAIHLSSPRRHQRMVAVNCAAIPRELLESELFGHEAGAFTGALKARIGRFEQAHGTSLMLDEIGDLELSLQAKLLRVLEDGSFERLGSNSPRHTDARLICATNRSLRDMVADGRFREDLLYRLNTVEIRLPPLRERIEDIPLLVRHLLPRIAKEVNPHVREMDASAYRVLMQHPWPGNVRELRNVLERAVVMCERDVVTVNDLPLLDTCMPARNVRGADAESGSDSAALPENEREWILDALRRNRFRRQATAAELGLARKTLYNKMRRYGLL